MSSIDPQMRQLAANVFHNAADYIDRHGWYKPDINVPVPNLMKPADIWSAVADEAGHERSGVGEDDYLWNMCVTALVRHFNVGNVGDVVRLNDQQPTESGQRWAVNNLRRIAAKIDLGKAP